MTRILVTGAGGFIGSHLCARLTAEGHQVYGVDLERSKFGLHRMDAFYTRDLRVPGLHYILEELEIDEVYHLAALMGGIGFITTHLADVAYDNALINLNTLEAARRCGRPKIKFLFSSSACIYPAYRQRQADVTPLRELDAMPAEPEAGYGWEKLFMEQMCEYYRRDYALDVRVVRFHNVFGPFGTWTGGKEKSPAAACRKIAELPLEGGEVEIWGDGLQTRSYMYIDDCVEGLIRLMASDHQFPLNLGRDEMVSINELFDAVAEIAGKKITKKYNLNVPQGVRGRNSDNTKLRNVLRWEPSCTLHGGLKRTYAWIAEQIAHARERGGVH